MKRKNKTPFRGEIRKTAADVMAAVQIRVQELLPYAPYFNTDSAIDGYREGSGTREDVINTALRTYLIDIPFKVVYKTVKRAVPSIKNYRAVEWLDTIDSLAEDCINSARKEVEKRLTFFF